MSFPGCYLGTERRRERRVKGGYTPRQDEKSVEDLDSKGFRKCPLAQGVRKPKKTQDLRRSEPTAHAFHGTSRNEARPLPPTKMHEYQNKGLIGGAFHKSLIIKELFDGI